MSRPDFYSTLVPEGLYIVGYRGCDEGIAFGRGIWFVHMEIVSPDEYQGLPILRCYNKPTRWPIARSG